MKTKLYSCVLLICLLTTPALAQTVSCDASPGFADFDFWVGDWDVYDTSNMLVGTNSIEKKENGCLLMETWAGAGGSTGISLNYFNPVTERWQQLWVSAGAYAIDIEGGLLDGSMVLSGKLWNYQGPTYDFRGTWTPNADGSVRQFFEQFNTQTGAIRVKRFYTLAVYEIICLPGQG
mgnify:CR=1 FL=1